MFVITDLDWWNRCVEIATEQLWQELAEEQLPPDRWAILERAETIYLSTIM